VKIRTVERIKRKGENRETNKSETREMLGRIRREEELGGKASGDKRENRIIDRVAEG